MKKRLLILYLISLLVLVGAAVCLHVPGYPDAEYYYSGGVRLASGHGLTENFLWNYLDNPSGLPHPSFTYWMPLPALIAAAGMFLSQNFGFTGARWLFIFLSAFLAPITAVLAYQIQPSQKKAALAGILSLAPVFYLPYLTIPETFVPVMLLGPLFLIAFSCAQKNGEPGWFLLLVGIIGGLMHLNRAEGAVWLAAYGLLFLPQNLRKIFSSAPDRRKAVIDLLLKIALLACGYLLVMGWWYLRNIQIYGTPMSPGSQRALWITDYNQMFNYPPDGLTFQSWLHAGTAVHLQNLQTAFMNNLNTWVGVQGEVVLFPLILAGAWRLRSNRTVQFGLAMWLLTFLVMTIVFPLAGSRGGFFHSGSAFQALWFILAAEGLQGFIDLGVRWRNWDPEKPYRVFGGLLVMLCVLLTAFLFWQRVIALDEGHPAWQKSWDAYVQAGEQLADLGLEASQPVLVNDPAGFFAATGRPAVVIPNGEIERVNAAARDFGARYWLVEENSTPELSHYYSAPASQNGWTYLSTVSDIRIYRFEEYR